MLAESPWGTAAWPWGVQAHGQLDHHWSPSAPMAAQCPPQGLVCAPDKVCPCPRAPGKPQVQAGMKSLQVSGAGVQSQRGLGGRVDTPKASVGPC